MKNAARIGPLAGQLKCKDAHSDDRPRRIATLDSPPLGEGEVLTPCDLRAWFDAQPEADRAAATVRKSPQQAAGVVPTRRREKAVRGGLNLLYARIDGMLDKIGPAVSGQGGHKKAFEAACMLVKGFDLDRATAMRFMLEWNRTCQPPWSVEELAHKVDDADEWPENEPRGHWRDRDRPLPERPAFEPPADAGEFIWEDEQPPERVAIAAEGGDA